MKSRFFVSCAIVIACLGQAFAGEKILSPVLSTTSAGKAFTFVCEVVGPEIKVFTGDEVGAGRRVVIDQKLDDSDSCNGGEWTVSHLTGTDTTLVMINPGRLGSGAQMNVYALRDGVVTFSGYLPAGADYAGGGEYFYDSEQADGRSRVFYEVSGGKIGASKEVRLVKFGSVCVDKGGFVTDGTECKGNELRASENRPLCVMYKGAIGKVSSIESCSQLIGHP